MSQRAPRRRQSDLPQFVQTNVDVDRLADEIFSRYAGDQPVLIDGVPYTSRFFDPEYCPDFRVMRLAGHVALSVNQRAARDDAPAGGIAPLRVTIPDIMLAALLHDLGKHHEDCAPFLDLLRETDLRGDSSADPRQRKEYLLGLMRDVHCRKGPCMIDRLRDAGRPELNNPFIATVARRHGYDYDVNRCAAGGCWWAREINIVTIADDYDAVTSAGPERAYKAARFTPREAAALLRADVATGRYEPEIADIFITNVLGLD